MAVELMDREAAPTLRERQKQQVREELLSSAAYLLEHNGFDAVSVDDIVARTGVAKGTFYLYFKTKGEVVASVLESLVAELAQGVSQALANAPDDASKALITAVTAQLDFFKERPSMIPLLLGGGLARMDIPDGNRSRICECCSSATVSTYERIIRKGMLQQHFREVDAQLTAQALYAMISGLAQDAISSNKPLSTVGALAVELIERGISMRNVFG